MLIFTLNANIRGAGEQFSQIGLTGIEGVSDHFANANVLLSFFSTAIADLTIGIVEIIELLPSSEWLVTTDTNAAEFGLRS